MIISNPLTNNKEFELIIANNYSRYDGVKVSISFADPLISLAGIALESPNLPTTPHMLPIPSFLKHFFPALSRLLYEERSIPAVVKLQEGLRVVKGRVIPIYVTD